ncbi:hypothetical protein LENED_008650 [Lentinula edodes]|uniref:Uncharacterized protein n=1 Tax=Lentinula edodes TaxID=5353 RepID=A0A1Q3EHK7_LENED|nr:hypothetical protein LENED_008650 [Lentinula edodes]
MKQSSGGSVSKTNLFRIRKVGEIRRLGDTDGRAQVLKFNIYSACRFAGQIYLRALYLHLPHHQFLLTIRKNPVMDPYPLLTSRLISLLLLVSSFFGVLAAPLNPGNTSLTLNTTSVQILQRDSPLDLYIKVGRRLPRALPNGTVIYGPVRSDKQEYSANEIWTISLGRNHVFKPRPYILAASTTLNWKMETIEPSQQGTMQFKRKAS